MKVFVLHYSKLVERKTHVIEQLRLQHITDYEFVELFDKDEITDAQKSDFTPNYATNIMSLFLKHIHVYKLVAEQYDNALILEDDVILHPNFSQLFSLYLSQLPTTYDLFYIGDGCKLRIPVSMRNPEQYIYRKELGPTSWGGLGSSRCTDSYLVSNACAKNMLEYWEHVRGTVSNPIDYWLSEVAIAKNLEVYWAEPTIVTQGSQNNLFSRSL
jgi:GR25 family glycosyltransferase involved in LPS biosynthesis